MSPLTKIDLTDVLTQFWNDQSGQGTVELAGWIVIAAIIVYATVSVVAPGGSADPTTAAKNEFASMYTNLDNF